MLEQAPFELYAVMARNKDLKLVPMDPLGYQSMVRPNHLVPPFDNPKARQALLYLVMGWLAVIAVRPLLHALSLPALIWLAAGCVIYTGGAVICVLDRPRLKPGHFGAHELWHALVLAGSACHFAVMLHLAQSAP